MHFYGFTKKSCIITKKRLEFDLNYIHLLYPLGHPSLQSNAKKNSVLTYVCKTLADIMARKYVHSSYQYLKKHALWVNRREINIKVSKVYH